MKADLLVILAPHFEHPGHLGAVRTSRFRRWASDAGIEVLIIRAASTDRAEERPWGRVLSIRDPFGFYRDPEGGSETDTAAPAPPRKGNRARQTLAYLAYVPDPLMAWGRRVLRAPILEETDRKPRWVLASSPPESSLLIASRLAERWSAALLPDFRDGWLDESMIPLINSSRLQRWRHARLERRIVEGAHRLSLSSDLWRDMLKDRYPALEDRMLVLPNSYPPDFPRPEKTPRPERRRLKLLYAGKIQSSRPERNTSDLLQPLIDTPTPAGILVFRGNLSEIEIREIESYRQALTTKGWELDILPPLPRWRLWDEINAADGLLLLSNSRASIPAKLFEYLPSQRPILGIAGENSILQQLSSEIPQLFLCSTESLQPGMDDFFRACSQGCRSSLPDSFREESSRKIFFKLLNP